MPADLCFLYGKYLEDILGVVRETVEVMEILKPVYNFKAE